MGSMTLTYGAASVVAGMTAVLCAALASLMERFGATPILSAQGSSVPFGSKAPFSAQLAATHAAAHATKNVVDRKASDWVLPRGQRL